MYHNQYADQIVPHFYKGIHILQTNGSQGMILVSLYNAEALLLKNIQTSCFGFLQRECWDKNK